MKIAITGGTGFVGRHLAKELLASGHSCVLIARGRDRRDWTVLNSQHVTFSTADLSSVEPLTRAFEGCDAVAHCAGINREFGRQTYDRVHVQGTRNVVEAARLAGVKQLVLLSFLRARPSCGSAYHESKWEAEEIIRSSGLSYTIFKAGMIYGRGDHMLDHLSTTMHTLPLLATVGFEERPVRPLPIEDLIRALKPALVENRLIDQTVAITGAEELNLSDAIRRVAQVVGRRVYLFPMPVWFHYILALGCEWTMKIPLVARAQVRILSEGLTVPYGNCSDLPNDLLPTLKFIPEQIRKGLPEARSFGLADFRWCCSS